MTSEATHGGQDPGGVFRVLDVSDGMAIHRMAGAVLKRHRRNAKEIFPREPYLAVEDAYQVLRFQFLHLGLSRVAFHAKRVGGLRAQQVVIFAPMRFVARCATLLERRLMCVRLLALVGDVGVATQANAYSIRFRKPGRLARVWAMAVGAISSRACVLDLGLSNLVRFVSVAGEAEFLRAGLRQDNLAIGGRLVTRRAGRAVAERRMNEGLQKFWRFGLVRIVASQAVGFGDGLVVMRPGEGCILWIVAVDAQRRRILGQMKVELSLAPRPDLVGGVAGGASHVQRNVTAAFFRNRDAHIVTGQAEVVVFVPCVRFQQLVCIRRYMGIVALCAVAHRRWMHVVLVIARFLVGVAAQAKRNRGDRLQLDPGFRLGVADFVATLATHRDSRVDMRAFGPLGMAFEALSIVRLVFQPDGMDFRQRGKAGRCEKGDKQCRS